MDSKSQILSRRDCPREVAIWWIRRDLRLIDNNALSAALQLAQWVIPLFIVDPAIWPDSTSEHKRLVFLHSSLLDLDSSLKSRKSYLVIRCGDPSHVFTSLVSEFGTKPLKVFAQKEYSPFARLRDEKLQRLPNINFHFMPGLTILDPYAVLKDSGEPYTKFTPYCLKWKSLIQSTESFDKNLLPTPNVISTPKSISSDPLPQISHRNLSFLTSEQEAQRRLSMFTSMLDAPIYDYHDTRDMMALDGTSLLSPYIRFGIISARFLQSVSSEAMIKAYSDEKILSVRTWQNELIWREFYQMISCQFPHVHQGSFHSKYDDFPWQNNYQDFQQWCEGQTGYPLIDAAMQQLLTLGWMHNRSRMIVASFLVKDLLIDWRWGEKWFLQHLVDGDIASNNGGWQWAAGTGTGAVPYFRVFNPILQSKKYDSDGSYIRRWLPSLSSVPSRYIHEPWLMSDLEQIQFGCKLGRDYPLPMIDHGWARQRVLDLFRRWMS